MPPSRREQRGFSLLELVSAVAVLAVLALLSLSGVRSLRERAQLTGCAGNLRQIGAVMSVYLADHDLFFPPTSWENQILVGGAKGEFPGYEGKPATRPLNAYVNNNYDIFRCPADVGYRNNPEREAFQPTFKGKTYFQMFGNCYRYNARSVGKGSLTKVEKGVNAEMHKLPEIRNPSRFIVMGDSDTFSWMPQSAGVPRWNTDWHGVRREGSNLWPICNVLFADGHIETIAVTNKPSPATFGDNYHFDIHNKP